MCPVHQQEHTDLMDTVFQLTLLVTGELSPHMIAFGMRLQQWQVDHKGGLPSVVEENGKLKGLMTPAAVLRLTQIRPEYMMKQLSKILSARREYAELDLAARIDKHRKAFQEIDAVCGYSGPETIAAVYVSAMTSLIKHGSFKVEDVTESAPKASTQSQVKAPADDTSSSLTELASAPLISQQDLSTWGFRSEFGKSDNVAACLTSVESLYKLRASLSAEMVSTCRTVFS